MIVIFGRWENKPFEKLFPWWRLASAEFLNSIPRALTLLFSLCQLSGNSEPTFELVGVIACMHFDL